METGRECNFLVLEDLDAVILERSEDIDGVPLNRPVPGRRLWFQTASGKAIVAFLPQATSKSILEKTLKQHADLAPNGAQLAAELDDVRQRGYAVSVGFRPEGLVSVGLPVLVQSGFAVAAIGTFLPVGELDSPAGATIVAQMQATTSRVSHYLGYESQVAVAVS
jgi:DNA-binding IclR family transcriptional regulator